MVAETLVSILSGFLGTCITTYSNYKMKSLEMEENKLKRQYELEKLRADTDSAVRLANVDMEKSKVLTDGHVNIVEAGAFATAQKQHLLRELPKDWASLCLTRTDSLRYVLYPVGVFLILLLGISDALKSLMPTMLTLYSVVIASFVTFKAWEIVGGIEFTRLTDTIAVEILQDACGIMLMLMVTLVTWWFGDRRMAKHLMHLSQQKDV